MLDIRKLLPKGNIYQVSRYRDLISVMQSFLYNDLKSQIEALRNKDYIDLASADDIRNNLYDFGFYLFEGQGWTGSQEYLKREMKTLVKRILNKGCAISYSYIFYVFNMLGDVYPTYLLADDSLNPWLTWYTDDEDDPSSDTLDTGLFLDMSPPFILDSGSFTSSITRHFLISYMTSFVENSEEFWSEDTMRALDNDVQQNKRKIEIPHYESRLYAQGSLSGGAVDRTYYTYDGEDFAVQKTILVDPGKNFTQTATIQFGSGTQPVIDGTITGVQELIASYPLSAFKLKLQDSSHLYIKNIMYPDTTWFDYKEVAVLDGTNQVIFYSTFPWVRIPPNRQGQTYLFLSNV